MASLIRFRAILLGALIALGFILTLALLGMALSLSIAPDMTLSITKAIVIGVLGTLVIVSAFGIAGAVACITTERATKRNFLVHSIGAWAVLALVLAIPVLLTTASLGLDLDYKPRIITDFNVFRTNATTTIAVDSPPQKETTAKKAEASRAMILLAWTSFLSLGLGFFSSIRCGEYIRRRHWSLALESHHKP